ncbi:restriction endonuclease subunit S [Parasphingorhabdus flavimaris]|uniref:restriction endonuclease subunit S n=1 Tax=Parasphingorhabdus flavimaris TaxID=266812 RepID=UPI003001548E
MMTNELPQGWIERPLELVLDQIVGGGTPSKSNAAYFQGEIPLMTVKDMKVSRPSSTGFNITERALEDSSAKLVPAGTIVIATRMGLGKVVRPKMDTAINQDLKAIFPSKGLNTSYLEWWLLSIASKIEAMGTGTTVKGVRLSEIRALEIPVAPLPEQERIVEKIETLFAELDKGEEALREVQKLLARYRQSVLKAAVTGALTADWRKANGKRTETGQDLLARILKQRRETWQGRGKYKEPIQPELGDRSELPIGWIWANGNQLFSWSSGKFLPNKKQSIGEVPVFGGNGVNGHHDEPLIDEATLVVGRVGAHCGNVHLTNGPSWVTDNAIYATSLPIDCSLPFLVLAFRSAKLGEKSKGGAQPFVNQDGLNSTLIALPPAEEQIEIFFRFHDASTYIESVTSACYKELRRSKALRQSILKDAFSGKLVPQDPFDEPAEKLLERIRASRSDKPKATRRRASA